jgi:hypothetical protein
MWACPSRWTARLAVALHPPWRMTVGDFLITLHDSRETRSSSTRQQTGPFAMGSGDARGQPSFTAVPEALTISILSPTDS